MGIKNHLGTITITDLSHSLNDGNAEIITVVYDSDDNNIQLYVEPYIDISTTSQGYGGETYTDLTYYSQGNAFTLDSNVYHSISEVYSTGSKTYITYIDTAGAGLFFERIGIYDNTTKTQDSSFIFNATSSDPYGPNGLWVDEDRDRAYIVSSNNNKVYVWDSDAGSSVASEDLDSSVLNNPAGIHLDKENNRAYVGSRTDKKIRAFNISAPTSPSHVSGEDIDLSSANASIDFEDFFILDGKAYVYDKNADYVRVFNVSSKAHLSGEDVDFSSIAFTVSEYHTNGESHWLGSSTDDLYLYDFEGGLLDTFINNSEITAGRSITGLWQVGASLFLGISAASGSNAEMYEIPGFVFPTKLVEGQQKDFISPNIGPYWKRSINGFQFIDGSDLIHFEPTRTAPYFELTRTPLSEVDGGDIDGVIDLKASVSKYSDATGKYDLDGSVTILAQGTNTPFTYSFITASGIVDNTQTSNVFTGLQAGTYRFRVTDSKNINIDVPSFTLNYRSTSFLNYGLFKTIQFDDANGEKWRFEIFDRDNTDSNTNLDSGADPILYTTTGEGKDIYENTIVPGVINLSLTGTNSEFVGFSTADDEKYSGVLSLYNGSTYDEQWRGYLNPNTYAQEFGSDPVNVTMSFTDRLGDLKNIDYANSNLYELTENYFGGDKTQLDVIIFCLKRLNMDMAGLRVAIDLFEDNHDSTSTDTPLEQTYVDTDSYFEPSESIDIPIQSSWKMDEVVKANLDPYSATLITWGGYFWIVKQEELLSGTSLSYVEYDMAGTQTGTGSQNTTVNFIGSQSTNGWRWEGGKQSLSTTQIYKDVKLILDTQIIEEGLTRAFIRRNALSIGVLGFSTFMGFQFIRGNNLENYITTDERKEKVLAAGLNQVDVHPKTPLRWTIRMLDLDNSATKIISANTITYSGTDKMVINIRYNVRPTYSQGVTEPLTEWPYFVMKWSFKVGDYYYDFPSQSWSTSTTVNQQFLTNYAKDEELSLEILLREVESSTEDFRLEVYAPTAAEYDVSNETDEAGMVTDIEAVSTADLTNGTRLIARYLKSDNFGVKVYRYHFYELREGQDAGTAPDVVSPNSGASESRWRLVSVKTLVSSAKNVVEFLDITPEFLPNSEEIPEQVELSKGANTSNKLTLESILHHFDTPPSLNNSEKLFYNVLKYDSDPVILKLKPTTAWAETSGISKRIQEKRVDWLVRLAKTGRQRISGSIISKANTPIGPLNVLLDTVNDNRRYLIFGGSWNLKKATIQGEFIEIGNDNSPDESSVDLSINDAQIE